MSRSACSALALILMGCAEPGVFRRGVNLNALEFEVQDLTFGVHPSQVALVHPDNPFVDASVEMKWEVESTMGPIPRAYIWATMLAREPIGENQFYAANALGDIYRLGLTDDSDLIYVREMAIAGFQQVLDSFPDSLTYDASGRIGYPVPPLAYDGILALGGTPVGWVAVATEDGGRTVVPVD